MSTATTTNQIFRRSLLAGSVSGMASTIILYPLDVLRTKLQAPHGSSSSSNSSSSSTAGGGPLAVLRQTVQFGGLSALYTGIALHLAAQVLYKATIFGVHAVSVEWVQKFKSLEWQKLGQDRRRRRQQTLDYVDTAICGFVAGAVNAGVFVAPVELVRNLVLHEENGSLQRSISRSSNKFGNCEQLRRLNLNKDQKTLNKPKLVHDYNTDIKPLSGCCVMNYELQFGHCHRLVK